MTKHLLDPELYPLLELMPNSPITPEMVPVIREMSAKTTKLTDPVPHGVSRTEIHADIDSDADSSRVRCLLYMPHSAPQGDAQKPGYVHIHGGGYILGSADASDLRNIEIAARLNAVVLSVDYRLAPEHPIPAPLDDCYAGLAWLHNHAEELNVDPARIAIGGESAGGGLAAATAILARDDGKYALCHQHLTYPMLDNRTGTEALPGDPLTGEFVWTRERNQFGWSSYLGEAPAEAPQVPARVKSYEELPATWMFTGSMDLFRDENIAYAQNLLRAGVATELLLYPNVCHGFQLLPNTKLGARFEADHLAALGRGLGVELAAQVAAS